MTQHKQYKTMLFNAARWKLTKLTTDISGGLSVDLHNKIDHKLIMHIWAAFEGALLKF
jgi:hypothetical protein